jgi:hypothetical protein
MAGQLLKENYHYYYYECYSLHPHNYYYSPHPFSGNDHPSFYFVTPFQSFIFLVLFAIDVHTSAFSSLANPKYLSPTSDTSMPKYALDQRIGSALASLH